MEPKEKKPIVVGRCSACNGEIVSGDLFWMLVKDETLIHSTPECRKRFMFQEIDNDNFDIPQYLREIGCVELEPSRDEILSYARE